MSELEQMRLVLEKALHELDKFSIKAEKHDAYEPIHIDIGQFIRFHSRDWEIVYGTPGSGKTILLKAWEEEIFNAVQRPSILPVYVSAMHMLGSPSADADPGERAELHFQGFLEEFGKQVKAAANEARVDESWVDRAFSGVGLRRSKSKVVSDLSDSINRAIQRGRPVRRPRDVRFEEEETRDRESRTRLGGKFTLGGRASGEVARSDSDAASSHERLIRSSAMEPHFAKVSELIEELAETLEVERFCILLDDWSLIEPRVQPWVGAWLQRALGAHPRIVVKIAANRDQTRLWDEQSEQGFRPKSDEPNDGGSSDELIDGGSLDHPQMEEADLVAFYERLLFKRLMALQGDLEYFLEGRGGRPSPEFVDAIFATREAFETLAKGTEGIPRSFLLALLELVDRGLPPDGWTVDEVVEVVGAPEQPLSATVKMRELHEIPEERVTDVEALLDYVIRPVVIATETRYFLVDKKDREQEGLAFEELLDLNLIYPDSSPTLPPALRDRFDGYWLSEERWRTFARAIMYKRELEEEFPEANEETLRPRTPQIKDLHSAEPFILDFTRWRA